MSKLTRRHFNKLLAGGAVAVPVSVLAVANAKAEDLPMVDSDSPTAKGLQYVVQTEKEGINCASCLLYKDDGSGVKGACTIFPNSLVPAEAWCAAYQPKP